MALCHQIEVVDSGVKEKLQFSHLNKPLKNIESVPISELDIRILFIAGINYKLTMFNPIYLQPVLANLYVFLELKTDFSINSLVVIRPTISNTFAYCDTIIFLSLNICKLTCSRNQITHTFRDTILT